MSRLRGKRNDLRGLSEYLPLEDFLSRKNARTGGYQVVISEREAPPREIPDWAQPGKESEELFQRMLLRSFPKFEESTCQRKRAGKWTRVRQLYYICNMTPSGVAEEMRDRWPDITPKVVKSILEDMKNVGEGLSANGRPRRPRGRHLLWREEPDCWIEDSNGNVVSLSVLLPPPKPKKAVRTIVIDPPPDHTRLELVTWLLSCFVTAGTSVIPSARMDTWVKAAKIPPRTLARVKKVQFTVGRPKFIYYFQARKLPTKWVWFLLNRHGRPATNRELAFLRKQLFEGDKSTIVLGHEENAA